MRFRYACAIGATVLPSAAPAQMTSVTQLPQQTQQQQQQQAQQMQQYLDMNQQHGPRPVQQQPPQPPYAPSPAPPAPPAPISYDTKPNVQVPSSISTPVQLLGQAYNVATGDRMRVTDGPRNANDQAVRMYDKFVAGDFSTYPGPLGQEIQAVYDAASQDMETPSSAVIAKMAEAIQKQVDAGRFVSSHLVNGAIDLRVRDLSLQEFTQLLTIAHQYGTVKFEDSPFPHLHVTIGAPQ